MNKIYILGIGPGSRDYLLPATEKRVQEAEILIGGERALKLFQGLEKEEIVIRANLEDVRDFIAANYRSRQIAVLVSGDPGLYSMFNYLKQHFPTEDLYLLPGISSMQLAFARAKISWQDACFISLHGNGDKDKGQLEELLQDKEKTGLFTDDKFPPDKVASYLTERGYGERKAVVAENLSYPEERIIRDSLKELSRQEFAGLSVMVIYYD